MKLVNRKIEKHKSLVSGEFYTQMEPMLHLYYVMKIQLISNTKQWHVLQYPMLVLT